MKIKLKNQNQRKIVYDILNIFYDHDMIVFVNENPDIEIDESHIFYKTKKLTYEDNQSLKTNLYDLLVEITSYKSLWGTLTGSKPSKLLKNKSLDEIKTSYRVSDQKIRLLDRTNKQQARLNFSHEAFSLYINIPFCPTRCDYCSYPTLVGINNDKSEYIDYLIREIEEIDLVGKLDSIYVGGGTPSFLSNEDITRLLAAINNKFTYQEFTYEAGRVDTLDRQKLDILKEGRLGRISLNPQTFNRQILRGLNRDIDLDRFIEIYNYAKSLGLIINMDFIIGLENENAELFSKNFPILARLLPDNITFHSLAIKSGSVYRQKNKMGEVEDAILISKMIDDFTRTYTYEPYYLYRQKNIISNLENVGYQRNDTASRYNIIINEELANIVGLGMNANSKFTNGSKFRNPRNLRDYYENFNSSIAYKNKLIREVRSWK